MKEDLMKFYDWLCIMSSKKKMNSICKEHYGIVDKDEGLSRAAYGSKTVSMPGTC